MIGLDVVVYGHQLLPQCWCRCGLVFNVRGNILGLPRERLASSLLPTFGGDDMAPLFEPSRANERLLIDSPCFYSFRLAEEYINNLCHGMPE